MARQQTGSLLDVAEIFHRRLSEAYDHLHGVADAARVRILTGYLGGHERRLADGVAAYRDQVPERSLRTWFRYTPEVDPLAFLDDADCREERSPRDLIDHAVRLDQALVRWYRDLAARAVAPVVKKTFGRLADLEEKRVTELTKDLEAFTLEN